MADGEGKWWAIELAAAGGMMAMFVGVHATPNPFARAAFLLIAAGLGALRVRWRPPAETVLGRFVHRVSETMAFIGVGFIAGATTGVILSLAAAIGALLVETLPAEARRWSAERVRAGLLAAVCAGGVFAGRWLHHWMKGGLVVICAACFVAVVGRVMRSDPSPSGGG